MSEFLVSLLMLVVFAGFWSLLFKLGGLDWLVDARMTTARRMLGDARFAFDGEVHAAPAKVAAAPVRTPAAFVASGWIPKPLAHA